MLYIIVKKGKEMDEFAVIVVDREQNIIDVISPSPMEIPLIGFVENTRQFRNSHSCVDITQILNELNKGIKEYWVYVGSDQDIIDRIVDWNEQAKIYPPMEIDCIRIL